MPKGHTNRKHSFFFKTMNKYWDNRCAYCMKKIPSSNIVVEHFIPCCVVKKEVIINIPKKRCLFNTLPTCRDCNHKKADSNPYKSLSPQQIRSAEKYFRALEIFTQGPKPPKKPSSRRHLWGIYGKGHQQEIISIYKKLREDAKTEASL